MSIAGFNPAGEMSQLRTQQTLAMQSAAPAGSAAPAAAAGAADPNVAAAAGAAAPGAAADASMGAAAVQAPPNTTRIILQSVMKGALTGASVTMGLKSFGPVLGHIGFLSKAFGALPAAAAGSAGAIAGKGILGFLGKIPVLSSILPMAFRSGIGGFVVTALIGAAVGGIVGVFTGMKAAKAQTAAYNEQLAAAQQQAPAPVGDPINTAPTPADGQAKPGPAPTGTAAAPTGKWKSWVIAKHGTHLGTQKTGHYNAKSGDTVAMLAKRFYTTPAEIRKLNPSLKGDTVPAGTKVTLTRKVVKDAKAWVA